MPITTLKHIPCPAGVACTSHNCLFNHDSGPSVPETTSNDPDDEYDPDEYDPAATPYDPASVPPPISSAPLPSDSPPPFVIDDSIYQFMPMTKQDVSTTLKRPRESPEKSNEIQASPESKRAESELSDEVPTTALVSAQFDRSSDVPSGSQGQSSSVPVLNLQDVGPVEPERPSERAPEPAASPATTQVPTPAPQNHPVRERPMVSVRAQEAKAARMAANPLPQTRAGTVITSGASAGQVPVPTKPQSEAPTTQKKSQAPQTPQAPAAPRRAPPAPSTKVILKPRDVSSQPLSYQARFEVIQMLHTELVRLDGVLRQGHPDRTDLFLSQDEVDKMALEIEYDIAVGSSAVYRNLMGSRLAGYKKMKPEDWLKEIDLVRNPPKPRSAGAPEPVNTGLTPEQEEFVATFCLTPIQDLAKHGYVPTQPRKEDVEQAAKAAILHSAWEKCDRCEQRFEVFPDRRVDDGLHTSGGKCTHHPGRPYFPDSINSAGKSGRTKADRKYRCCNQGIGDSAGCTVADGHVFKVTDPARLAHLLPFMETPENPSPATNAKVVCFDCEMCYTVYGIELVRLTATAWPSRDTLLDVLVRPQGAILDLNSRYSGVFPQDISNALPWTGFEPPVPAPDLGEKTIVRSGELRIVESPAKAREIFFKLISPETILVGHGLENDLNVTRIIHPKLIDTVLLFPHRAGLPIRNGLKALSAEFLNWKIQTDNGEGLGHDSAEDARAAGELVRYKIKEKWKGMQSRGWTIKDGVCVGPSWEAPRQTKPSMPTTPSTPTHLFRKLDLSKVMFVPSSPSTNESDSPPENTPTPSDESCRSRSSELSESPSIRGRGLGCARRRNGGRGLGFGFRGWGGSWKGGLDRSVRGGAFRFPTRGVPMGRGRGFRGFGGSARGVDTLRTPRDGLGPEVPVGPRNM